MKKLFHNSIIVFVFFTQFICAQGAGNCIDFGSSGNNYIDCGSPASLEISSAITVEAWIYVSSFINYEVVCAKIGTSTSQISYALFTGSSKKMYYELSKAAYDYTTATGSIVLSTNTWYHVALAYDGTNITGYINGQQDVQMNYPGSINTSTSWPFWIGSYKYYNYPFRGKIDEVRVWNKALDISTIRNWMHKEVTNSHPDYLNLKGYWKLNESSGTTASDASGNSANGTLTNSPSWTSSTAPLGSEGAFVNSTSQTNVGPTGGQIKTTITSTPDNSNNLGVYQFGSVDGTLVSGETYPSGIDKRTNIVWGITKRGSVTANIVFDYSQVSGILSPSTVKLIKRTDASSTTWTEVTLSSRDNDLRTLTVNDATSFSEFAIGAGSDNPLPVEIKIFNAEYYNHQIHLNWQTATEINNYGFEVQRKNEYTDWTKIGFVNGNGNCNSPKNYFFIDNPANGSDFFYRLKQIDFDGRFEFSNELKLTLNTPNKFFVYQNYPNPFNPETRISYQISAFSHVSLKVYDVLGREIATLVTGFQLPGIYNYQLFTSNYQMASGIYFYTLYADNFVLTKKMLLIK